MNETTIQPDGLTILGDKTTKRGVKLGVRSHRDRGEGIISTAIAVLIVAFLGAAMWVAFDNIWGSAETSIREQVRIIGSDSSE